MSHTHARPVPCPRDSTYFRVSSDKISFMSVIRKTHTRHRQHLLWRCQLAQVEEIRRDRLAPAVRDLGLALDTLGSWSRNVIMCAQRVCTRWNPRACRVCILVWTVFDPCRSMRVARERRVCGLCWEWWQRQARVERTEVQMVLRKMRPLLTAIFDMQRAVERAAAKVPLAMAYAGRVA